METGQRLDQGETRAIDEALEALSEDAVWAEFAADPDSAIKLRGLRLQPGMTMVAHTPPSGRLRPSDEPDCPEGSFAVMHGQWLDVCLDFIEATRPAYDESERGLEGVGGTISIGKKCRATKTVWVRFWTCATAVVVPDAERPSAVAAGTSST